MGLISVILNLVAAVAMVILSGWLRAQIVLAVLVVDMVLMLYLYRKASTPVSRKPWLLVGFFFELQAALLVGLPLFNVTGPIIVDRWLAPWVLGMLLVGAVLEGWSLLKRGGDPRRPFEVREAKPATVSAPPSRPTPAPAEESPVITSRRPVVLKPEEGEAASERRERAEHRT